MPDGTNFASIMPDTAEQWFATPQEAAAATPQPSSQPTTSPSPPGAAPSQGAEQWFATPQEAAAATPQAAPAQPPAQPAPAAQPQAEQPPAEQWFATPQEAAAAQPAQPPQESGLFSGLLSGAGAAVREGGQTLSGNAFTDTPNAQPEPTRGFFNEVGYGLGHSFPVIGAGLAAGGAGTAVGGPVGGVVGSALGVGAMSAAQDLAPVYAQARANGMDHDAAVDYAIKHAAASGIIGAATAPLFELAPFKSFVGKLLFNSLVTQPAAGGATRVGVPLAMGEPLPSGGDLARGYGQDVASGVAFGVGHKAYEIGKGVVAGRPTAEPAPTEPAPEQPPPEQTPSPPVPAEPGPAPTAPAEAAAPPAPPAVPEGSVAPVEPTPEVLPRTSGSPGEPPVPGPVAEPSTSTPPGSETATPPTATELPPTPPEPAPVPTDQVATPPQSETGAEAPVTQPASSAIPPPDDRSGITTGRPEPATGVGETGTPGLPTEQPGGVRPGDQGLGAGDTPPAQAAPAAHTEDFRRLEQNHFPEAETANFRSQYGAVPVEQVAEGGQYRLRPTDDERATMWALTKARDADGNVPVVLAPQAYQPRMSESHGRPLFVATNSTFDFDHGPLRANLTRPAVVRSDGSDFLPVQRGAIDTTGASRVTPQPGPETGLGTTRTTGPTAPTREVQPPGAEPATAIANTPTGDRQLDALIETRNRPTTNPARLPLLDRQIAARQATLEAKGGPRVGGRKTAFAGPPEVRTTTDPMDYKFNNGTSVYRSVFEQAGHNPDLAVNRPIELQNQVLTKHMENTFGYKSVELAPDNKGMVNQKIARDAMLDMTRATQDMMASVGLPYEAASLNGRLKLVMDPEGKRSYYGQYSTAGEIRITGGANSFGHEWTHAVDHMLAERLTGNPGIMNNLLTRYARGGVLDPKDGVQGAFAKVLNTMFYDKAAQAARQIDLQRQASATDRLGNPTKGATEAQTQLQRLEAAGSKLRIQPTEYRAAAMRSARPDYYADPAEMLARAHEAWLARQMQNDGSDPRGAVMPDEAYIRETNRQMAEYYPQAEDRMNIFKAFDELHQTMRNEQVLSEGKVPQGKSDLGISDLAHYGATVPPHADPNAVRDVTGIVGRIKNQTNALLNSTILTDPSRPSAGERPLWRRAADYARMLTYSHHGIMETIIKRAPKGAQTMLRDLMDRVAAAPGEGRVTHENFEEAVRNRSRGWTGRFANILKSAGYKNADAMSVEEGEMLRHVLTTGETRYPLDPSDVNRTGPSKPIPENLQRAGGQLRQLMDEIWRQTHDVGIDVGYARSGYYPRLYDALKVTASAASKDRFLQQAHLLHSTMFDQELGDPGSDPAALHEKWASLSRADQQIAPVELQGHMNELRANLRRQGEIETQLQAGRDPAFEAELAQRQNEASQIAEAAHPMLRDHTATLASSEWLSRIMGAGMHDFDSTGPSGKYLKTRTLPPEADQIMREFLRTSPTDALPNYFHAAARRVSYAERFGANGEDLDAIMKRVTELRDMNTHDATWFKQQIDAVTGRQNTSNMQGLMKFSNMIHAAGSIALMPRAAWSALAEPMNAALATGSLRTGFETFANQFGQLMRTASAKQRTEMAEYLTTVTGDMHDSIMMSRMSANYDDSPALNKFMSNYYRITGLTQLTNSQRIASTGASHGFLAKLSRDYQGGDAPAKDTATRWLRELGLPDAVHGDFAKWMTDFKGGRPTVAQLRTDPMSGAYGLAIRRLVDRSIQDPYKVDRAAMSSVPFAGLAFQLMSFNYQFQRNVLQPAMDQVAHAYQTRGLGAATGSAVHAATMAGAMVGAGMLTTAMRQYLFTPDQWDQHEKDGDLGSYLVDLAMQRSGLNGTLDPIIQLGTNLRYNANVSSLLEGASINWLAKNAQDVIAPFVTANDSPNTNTRYFNAARGTFNLLGVPAAAFGLTKLGAVGGPLAKVAAGAALQYGTSPGMAADIAETVAGHKGAKLPAPDTGKLPGLPSGMPGGMPDEESFGGRAKGQGPAEDASGGMMPWGLADDVAKPAWQVAGEPIVSALGRLPGPVKVLGGLGAAAYGAKSFLDTTEPWRGLPPPERPNQPAAP